MRGAPLPVTAVQPGASLAGKLSTEAVSQRSRIDPAAVGWRAASERRPNGLDDLSVISGNSINEF
jgi:hypothetical protein